MKSAAAPISVYIHFPWCRRKCPYCDFATRAVDATQIPQVAYADAVIGEFKRRVAPLQNRQLVSVFFGGGTPSLWSSTEVGRVLDVVVKGFAKVSPDLEVTLECNPDSLIETQARGFVAAGINRLSVGVQSLQDDQLQFLGRLHDSVGAINALRAAAPHVDRLSGDLMFGMQNQSSSQLEAELDTLLQIPVEHLSVYALTVEPRTSFGTLHRQGRLPLATDERYAELFSAAEDFLCGKGFVHYEVSNYAKPGQESLHNQHYWQGGDYIGLGAGAVGCVPTDRQTKRRYVNHDDPLIYMARSTDATVEAQSEDLTTVDMVNEALLLGLRTVEGVNIRQLQERTGHDPMSGRLQALDSQQKRGNLAVTATHWVVPQKRWLHLDGIVRSLFQSG